MNIHYIWTKATRWLLISFDNVRGRSVFSGKQGISEDKEGHQPAVMDLNSTVNESGFRERDQSTRVLTGCFLSLLILSTLLGNMLVCAAVTKFRHLRSKVTNFFVISLAVSDLLVAILVMPWKAVTEITGFWPFGSFCNVWVAFDIMCSTASILNLCVISVDRYWAISSPFRYERKMTPRVAFVMISAAWTLSVLISFIPVHLKWHKAPPTNLLLPNASRRAHRTDNCDSSLNRTYAISSSLVSFYIPVAIMIMTYTQIYRIAQKQIRRITALERAAESAKIRHEGTASAPSADPESSFKLSFKRETKVLKTLSVIMGVFVCCWLPFFVLNCVVPFCERDHAAGADVHATCVSPTTFDVFVWFGWANSSLNPIIYAFNTDFRRAFAVLLGCQRVCPGKNMMETPCLKQQLKKHYTALLSSSVGPDGPLARKQTCSKMQPVSQHLVQEKASGQEGEGIWD